MIDEKIKEKLRYLKLCEIEGLWDQIVSRAIKEQLSPTRFLNLIIDKLYEAKIHRVKSQRLNNAKIPEVWVMATYPFAKQPKLNKRRITNIHDSLEYMKKKQNIILVGPTGVGKTGIGTSFLIQAISEGYRGLYIAFPELISTLYASVASHREERALKKFAAFDCLLIDEIGYVDVEPAQVGLFFRLMSLRHRTKTTIVTSNLGFQDWGAYFKNQQLTAALLDRLTEASHVINMQGCVSIREKPTKTT